MSAKRTIKKFETEGLRYRLDLAAARRDKELGAQRIKELEKDLKNIEAACRAYQSIAERSYILLGIPNPEAAVRNEFLHMVALPAIDDHPMRMHQDAENQLALTVEQLHKRYNP